MARRNSPDVASATKKEGFCGRERLHKEVASPLGFVAGQIDRIVGKINHTGGLQNETALHR